MRYVMPKSQRPMKNPKEVIERRKRATPFQDRSKEFFQVLRILFWGKLGGDKDRYSKQGGPRVIGMKRKPSEDNK